MPSRTVAVFRVTSLAAVAAAIYLRAPNFFHAPRFWAEEALLYFTFAYSVAHGPWWYQGLLTVKRGYFAAWTNLSTTLGANFLPLAEAPLLTTLLAALVQLAACALIVWSRARFWCSPLQKTLGLACVLFAPLSGEIWLNTINSQFYFALAAFLILIEPVEPASRSRAWFHRVLLALGGLTGLVTIILAPLFALAACWERSRERAIQAVIVCACAVLQLTLLLSASASDRSVAVRFRDVTPLHLAPVVWTQSLGMVGLGVDAARAVSAQLVALATRDAPAYAVLSLVLALLAGLVLARLSARLPRRERVMFIGAYGLLLAFSYFGSLGSSKLDLVTTGNGERYFYVPNVILLLIVASNSLAYQQRSVRSIVCTALLAWMVCLGASRFQSSLMLGKSDWRTQVAQWETDPARRLEVWPDGWTLILRKR